MLRPASVFTVCSLLVPSHTFAQDPAYVIPGLPGVLNFRTAVSGAGDFDGDGFDDFVVGSADEGSARNYSGRDGSLLQTLTGAPGFGYSVSDAGDVNGDGFGDVIIGNPAAGPSGIGRAWIHSGDTGALLYTFSGAAPGDSFGDAVSGAGDVNGDGFDDVIVGANPGSPSSTGYARVFSGADGGILHTFAAPTPGRGFGASVLGAGDVDGDGFDDIAIGARNISSVGNSDGVWVYSGVDGALLYVLQGDNNSQEFGSSIDSTGDIDGDGRPDLIVGAPLGAYARIHSGASGAILRTLTPPPRLVSEFGKSVAGLGDVDGDGVPDVAVSDPLDDPANLFEGSVRIFSGNSGVSLYELRGQNLTGFFGDSISAAGDTDGRGGAQDLIIGERGSGAGITHVYQFTSWKEHELATEVPGFDRSRLGTSMTWIGDLTGDGVDDALIGAPEGNPLSPFNPIPNIGAVGVYDGGTSTLFIVGVGTSPGNRYGHSVDSFGDLGVLPTDAIAIGIPGDDRGGSNAGAVEFAEIPLFPPPVLITLFGDSAGDEFGHTVLNAGDLNGDGQDDLLVSAPFDDALAHDGGTVYAYALNGIGNPTLLWSTSGAGATDHFGMALCMLPDLDGDGVDDVLVGIPGADVTSGGTTAVDSGVIAILSGASGSALNSLTTLLPGDAFGSSVSGLGDVNNDGLYDFVVGAPFHDVGMGNDNGCVYIYSYVPGPPSGIALLGQVVGGPNAKCGTSVKGVGDVDGDALPDLAIGCPGSSNGAGSALVYSFAKGDTLFFRNGAPGDRLGTAVTGGADLNQDRLNDVLFGAPDAGNGDGGFFVYSSVLNDDAGRARPFGAACGPSGRLARISSRGRPQIGETLEIRLRGAAPNALAALDFGFRSLISLPLDLLGFSDCFLHANGVLQLPAVANAAGQTSTSISIPNDPSLTAPGELAFQWITLEPAPQLVSFSDGLLLDIGR